MNYEARGDGEKVLFGVPDGGVKAILIGFGYRIIRNVSDREYLPGRFPENPGRVATGLLSFCHAEICGDSRAP